MSEYRRRINIKEQEQKLSLGTIWYWTTDGEESIYYTTEGMLSHSYDSKGIIEVNENNKTIFSSGLQNSATVQRIKLPDGITTLERYACYNCPALEKINLPKSLTTIGSSVFLYAYSLTIDTIHLPNLVTLNRLAEHNLHIKHITSLGYISSIPNEAFRNNTELEDVILPDSLTTIWGRAFQNCSSLTTINLPESLTSIGNLAFNDCTALTIETIHLPNLTFLSRLAENDLHTKHITSLGSITSIDIDCFYRWTALEDVNLPETLTSIWARAFNSCTSLTTITIHASTPPTLGNNVFQGCPSLVHIYVPAAAMDNYKVASGWSSFASIISAIPE